MVEANNNPAKMYSVFHSSLQNSRYGGGVIGIMSNGQPVKYQYRQEMVHVVTIDGQEYVVRGDDEDLRESPPVIETGGNHRFRLGKDRRGHGTYLEIDGARHIDIPYKIRKPLARGEMKDTVVGDVRLIKFPLRKGGRTYSVLISHDATN